MSTHKINKVQIKVNKSPPNVNQNNCSGCGGGGGGGGQGLSTVDPRNRVSPVSAILTPAIPIPNNCSGSPKSPIPDPIPTRLPATGGKNVNIIHVRGRGATVPEQVFGYPDPRKARLGAVGCLKMAVKWGRDAPRQAQPDLLRLFTNFG